MAVITTNLCFSHANMTVITTNLSVVTAGWLLRVFVSVMPKRRLF